MRAVFVPYRGIYFLYEVLKVYRSMGVVFVPYRGIYFLYRKKLIAQRIFCVFSSPIGESTFSTLSAVNVHKFGDTVFVPYRGIYFLYTNIDGEPWFNATRFRPLSGNLLSLQTIEKAMTVFPRKFSSPIGESTFSTTLQRQPSTSQSSGFRPLSGNLLSLPCL